MNGILVINKEKGYTSHDVVAKLRGILHEKKIGHTGTLDPDATGVLPVCVGNATKVCDLITDGTKTYTAGVLLGTMTDTQDISGTVLKTVHADVPEETLRKVAESFIGEILQLTPMYSARKVGGVKLVDLARKGITVERERKTVRIHSISVSDYDREKGTFSMRVVCSKGTYIRTLCNDIGETLGCGACMSSLVRNETGGFSLGESYRIEEIKDLMESGRIVEALIPAERLFDELPAAHISPEGRPFLLNGNPIRPEYLETVTEGLPKRIRVYDGNEFKALYEYRDQIYRPYKMFL